MKLIRVNGQLVPDGVVNRMRLVLIEAKIAETENRKQLRTLSREWWREFFKQRRAA